MNEQRVGDERLLKLMGDMENVIVTMDEIGSGLGVRADFEDNVVLLRELQQCRSQRCETCRFQSVWMASMPTGEQRRDCCDRTSDAYYFPAPDDGYCGWWEAKEESSQ